MKKHRASKKKKRNPFLNVNLHNHSLPTYLALRRQKVKFGPLKTAADSDLEMLVCVPDAVMLED